MANIDYLTVSLGTHTVKKLVTTQDVLTEFSAILPGLYKDTCKERLFSGGKTMRVSQYGITVAEQYGSAHSRGWEYSVQLSGDYWQAIGRDRDAVLKILSGFTIWRVSRLDLAHDACVPLEDWQNYYKAAFEAGYALNGIADARTVYYGSRLSQFFTRVYNKSAEDSKHYPAPEGFSKVRFEIEIHRVKGELVLEHTFDDEFTDQIFLQRVHRTAENDSSGFIMNYFSDSVPGVKIRTVERVIGNLEKTIDYVFTAYAPYIAAVMHSQLFADRYVGIEALNKKGKKILAVLDSELSAIVGAEYGKEENGDHADNTTDHDEGDADHAGDDADHAGDDADHAGDDADHAGDGVDHVGDGVNRAEGDVDHVEGDVDHASVDK